MTVTVYVSVELNGEVSPIYVQTCVREFHWKTKALVATKKSSGSIEHCSCNIKNKVLLLRLPLLRMTKKHEITKKKFTHMKKKISPKARPTPAPSQPTPAPSQPTPQNPTSTPPENGMYTKFTVIEMSPVSSVGVYTVYTGNFLIVFKQTF